MNHEENKENKENLKEEKVCDLKAGYNQHAKPSYFLFCSDLLYCKLF